ncbi:MAG: hypothetical protein IMZ61_06510, partial [Planctomycetes bacterium]|nr:hypothetical protein [Planctomycetota bacterium]
MLFCSIYNPNPVFTSITVTGLTPAGLVKNSVAGLLSTEAFGTSTYIPYSSGTGFSYSANLTFAADVLATTEINIGAIGSTGTKLAIGTNSTTETYPGIIEIVSDSTHLFTTSAGLVVDAFFSPNPTPVFSMAGYFNNASAGSYITTGKTYLGLYGGTNVSLDITNTASARGLNIQGLQFSAYNNADMSKSLGLLTSFITIWGMLLTSSFGYAGKTISGSKITETAHCSELQSTIAGTYNATQAGNNYGERITVVDSLEAASTGNVTSYGLHITVPATVTKAGGGVLTSWGIYEASQVDNLFYGNVRIGSLVAPTVALDVTGAGLFSTTLGVTGLITATGGITIGAGSTTVWPLRFTSGPFLTTPV